MPIEQHIGILGGGHEFAYPHTYDASDLALDAGLYATADKLDMMMSRPSGEPLSPARALAVYYQSHLGGWHSKQDGRYSAYHRDLNIPPMVQALGVTEGSQEERQARIAMLHALSMPHAIGPDIDTLRHQARVTGMACEAVGSYWVPYAVEYDNVVRTSLRHLFTTHETGENTHPGLLAFTSLLPGDRVSGTKDLADHEAERAIDEAIRGPFGPLHQLYPPDIANLMTKYRHHEIAGLTHEQLQGYFSAEVIHSWDFLRNALDIAKMLNADQSTLDFNLPRWARLLSARLAIEIRNNRFAKLGKYFAELDDCTLKDLVVEDAHRVDNNLAAIPNYNFDNEVDTSDLSNPFYGLPDITQTQQRNAMYRLRQTFSPIVPLRKNHDWVSERLAKAA